MWHYCQLKESHSVFFFLLRFLWLSSTSWRWTLSHAPTVAIHVPGSLIHGHECGVNQRFHRYTAASPHGASRWTFRPVYFRHTVARCSPSLWTDSNCHNAIRGQNFLMLFLLKFLCIGAYCVDMTLLCVCVCVINIVALLHVWQMNTTPGVNCNDETPVVD